MRTLHATFRMNPDVALQMAAGILERLGALPDDVKRRYNIPSNIEVRRDIPS
jgi:hypothetical protein